MPAGAVTLQDITSQDWSLTLDSSTSSGKSGSGIGSVVQGIADINQCVGIILSTPKGSDPLRPNFACDIWRLLDRPIDIVRPALVRDIFESITIWEPRVRVISVIVNLVSGTLSNLLIQLTWQLKIATTGLPNQHLTLTVPRNLA